MTAAPGVPALRVEPLTPEAYAPFGWVLGIRPPEGSRELVQGLAAQFWHERVFDAGDGGQTELVWVEYQPEPPLVVKIEAHRLTEQALVPVGGTPIIHIVAPPNDDPTAPEIAPDLSRAKAFYLDGTRGVCMRRGTWHIHLGIDRTAVHLMVSRRSTTTDLIGALRDGMPLAETEILKLDPPLPLDISGIPALHGR